eukprot:343398-Amphidinium_carterae.1
MSFSGPMSQIGATLVCADRVASILVTNWRNMLGGADSIAMPTSCRCNGQDSSESKPQAMPQCRCVHIVWFWKMLCGCRASSMTSNLPIMAGVMYKHLMKEDDTLPQVRLSREHM